MLYIRHRLNNLAELEQADPDQGVEIDLRSSLGKGLRLSHDPVPGGQDFISWLDCYQARKFRGPLVLNTKEDGLEERIISLLQERGIENYLFLDTAAPTLVHWGQTSLALHFFLRLSTFEPLAALEPFVGRMEWVWLDCFGGVPLSPVLVRQAKTHFKICLVSPELQGQASERIHDFAELFPLADAVCTKVPESWRGVYCG
jgi:hypothetical protein